MLRHLLDITGLYLRITYSSRSTLIFQIVMPLLFTFLIGQATGGFGGGGNSSLTTTWTVAVTNEDEGSLGEVVVSLLAEDPHLEVVAVEAETAVAQAENSEVAAALIISPQFSRAALAAEPLALDFYQNPENQRNAQPVAEAVKGNLDQLQGYLQAASVSAAVATELGQIAAPAEAEAYKTEALAKVQTAWADPPLLVQINEDELIAEADNVIPSGINQSAPGMMAMFVTFGMLGGAAVLIQERKWGTLRRLAVMPISRSSIIGGKLVGIVAAGILQMAILIIAGALLFGIAWGQSPPALTVMVVAFALCISSLGMMMAVLVKTVAQANALGTVLVLSMAALGGAWWPLEIVPDWMQIVGRFSPIYWAMSGFHDIITRGLGMTAVLPEALVLMGFTAVFLTIAIRRFK